MESQRVLQWELQSELVSESVSWRDLSAGQELKERKKEGNIIILPLPPPFFLLLLIHINLCCPASSNVARVSCSYLYLVLYKLLLLDRARDCQPIKGDVVSPLAGRCH